MHRFSETNHPSDWRCFMQNLSNKKSPSRRRPLLPLQREDVPGCKQVPRDEVGGKILWAHPDGYFINALGQNAEHTFSPAMQGGRTAANPSSGGFTGSIYPKMRHYRNKTCHIIMAIAFYGPRPTYSLPLQGKGGERGSYVGICHHLINDKLDYRPANLLCWLTREQHYEADRRQRALRKILPDMHALTYDRHRVLQDPRVTTREAFDVELIRLARDYEL